MSDAADAAAADDRAPGDRRRSTLAAYLGIAACYLATVVGGLALADEAAELGLVLFENPDSVGNVGVFAAMVVGFTAVFVAAVRLGKGLALLRVVLVVAFGGLVAAAVVLATGIGGVFTEDPLLVGLPSEPVSAGIALGTAALLWAYPEWYVIDVVAVVAGAGAIAMLGLSFGPLPIVVLLVTWAAYDAYAVYGSGHMKDVAAGAGSLKLPMVYVVPTERDYSLRESDLDLAPDGGDRTGDDAVDPSGAADRSDRRDTAEGRSATILGLGDALIPGMLAVSAGRFLDAPVVVPALSANAPAIGALAGGVVGLGALAVVLSRYEGAHAGLPPLNAGVLAGYLAGAAAAGVPLSTALGL